MKAVRVHEFGGPEQLEVEDVEEPRPAAGEVLVEMHAIGINPVDTYIRSGTHAVKPALPYTPGSDGAGIVLSVGEGVQRLAPGDRVYVAGSRTGTYAERAVGRESQVQPLPERTSFAEGAALGVPYSTAYRALFQIARAAPGEWLLVRGASGGVGVAAVQLARAAGLTVIGTAGTEAGKALVREQGAHHVLDHGDVAGRLQDLTGGRGADLILEMLANRNLAEDLTLLARRGRVVVIGNRGTIEINPRDAMRRDAAIFGMTLFNATEEERSSIHAALRAALENGTVRPVIGRRLPLAEARRAHELVLEPGARGKIVLVPASHTNV
jgi:NADPH2:quinone reductase